MELLVAGKYLVLILRMLLHFIAKTKCATKFHILHQKNFQKSGIFGHYVDISKNIMDIDGYLSIYRYF